MVELFEASIIKFLKDKFLQKFGISVPFKYSPEMDFIEEFRRDRFSKIKQEITADFVKELIGENTKNISLAIWKRTPIKKYKDDENGITSFKLNPFDKLVINTNNGIELRDVFYGKTDFTVQFFSSESKIIYMIELLYNTEFLDVNPPIKVTYSLDGEPLELDYNTYFNEIESIDYINIQNYGSMRLIEFSFSVYGIFFSPYYYLDNTNTIEEINLRVFSFNKEVDLNILKDYAEGDKSIKDEQNLNNYKQLVCSQDCKVENEKINIDSCKTLNN